MTTLTNKQSKISISLPYDLYPIDDLNWSAIVASGTYLFSGAYDVQQGIRKAGKPITLQSDDGQGLGLITRDTVNKLREQCDIVEATFTLSYEADNENKSVDVMFDHTQTPIEAKPAKDFNSPNLDDWFLVTLKFRTV